MPKTSRKGKKGSKKKSSRKGGLKKSVVKFAMDKLKKKSKNKMSVQNKVRVTSRKAPVSKAYKIERGDDRTNVIEHCEYLQPINGSINFTTTVYAIQPGLSDDFPWLAPIAGNFEQYKIEFLEWQYRPLCPTSTAGRVAMVTQFDAADSPFLSFGELANYAGSKFTNAWDSLVHQSRLRRADYLKKYFVRVGDVPSNGVVDFYDVGNFTIATYGCANANQIGDLWVSYRVRFIKPRLQPGLALGYLESVVPGGDVMASSGTPRAVNWFGTTNGTITYSWRPSGFWTVPNATHVNFLDPGYYFLDIFIGAVDAVVETINNFTAAMSSGAIIVAELAQQADSTVHLFIIMSALTTGAVLTLGGGWSAITSAANRAIEGYYVLGTIPFTGFSAQLGSMLESVANEEDRQALLKFHPSARNQILAVPVTGETKIKPMCSKSINDTIGAKKRQEVKEMIAERKELLSEEPLMIVKSRGSGSEPRHLIVEKEDQVPVLEPPTLGRAVSSVASLLGRSKSPASVRGA